MRVAAAGACHSDLHLMHDFDPGLLPYTLPFTLGHENTGIVESAGAGVQHLAPGEPVAVCGPWGCGRCWRCHQQSGFDRLPRTIRADRRCPYRYFPARAATTGANARA